jgi:hypothetical protein
MAPPSSLDETSTRNWLAINMSVGGLAIVVVLGGLAIFFAPAGSTSEETQHVMGAVLPLVGTWVGTVLAFYFAKENFESAARNTKTLLGLEERLRMVPASQAMISIDDATLERLKPGAKADDLVLSALTKVMRDAKRQRLPILKSDGSACLIFHLSTITEYLTSAALAGVGKALDQRTVADLRADAPDLYKLATAFVTIRRTATLADAKVAMESRPGCADVFVTETGRPEEPVLGWITNVEIRLRSAA